jgi:CheY-like chemotaxis protein
VEDEKAIRYTASLFLEDLGYTVLTAESPAAALELTADHPDPILLLITDVVMPGMSGRDLALRLTANHPSLKVLYISGYTANVIAHRGILEDGVHFLSKPISRDDLVRKVREIIGE